MIKANLGRGESPREEEMIADGDGEKEMRELREPREVPVPPRNQTTKVKGKMPRTKQFHIPKQASIVISAKARMVQCDWCQMKGIECFS